jgi:hypothetical protein
VTLKDQWATDFESADIGDELTWEVDFLDECMGMSGAW